MGYVTAVGLGELRCLLGDYKHTSTRQRRDGLSSRRMTHTSKAYEDSE